MEEVILTRAYVHEEDGRRDAFHCTVENTAKGLTIRPRETLVDQVHVRLTQPMNVTVEFAGERVNARLQNGWITRTGIRAE